MFEPEMMQLAAFSWEWVLTASSSLNLSMVADIVDAWIWTVRRRMGIFAGNEYENTTTVLNQPGAFLCSPCVEEMDGLRRRGRDR